ncbi:hypothetical protein L3Q82_017657 [Scortum barcoo]|uniref:Uncharacterized protein n=1 Tax=Scortum barcoo TaxID=214431 RepID=A0ACB8VLN8_9TELE|nr:hypothetical protein L3Q82_017657 [Scortum barcoo]
MRFVFVLVVEHWTSSIPSTGCLRVYGSLPNQSTCALWIWRRHSTVSLVVFCGGAPSASMGSGAFAKGMSVRSLYDRSRSLVRIAGSVKPGAGGSPGLETTGFHLCFLADDVVLMASSGQDLQHVLERFAAECEAAGMRISTSKSWRPWFSTGKGWRVLSSVRSYAVGVPDRRMVKKELSRKAKLSIYRSIYAPTLTYGHELWGEKLSVTREELGVEPLLLRIERSQLRWLGHLFRMPPGRLPREVFQAGMSHLGGGLGEDPGHAGETMSLGWPGNASGSPRKSWRKCLG